MINPDQLFHLYTGRCVRPVQLRAHHVDIKDIARSLSMQCRFLGHVTKFYSVAEHCWHASYRVEKGWEREALLHDAAECYMGDMIRPWKSTEDLGWEFRKQERKVEAMLAEHFDISYPMAEPVRLIDNLLLRAEQYVLQQWPQGRPKAPALVVNLHCWPPGMAEEMFLARYHELEQARTRA